MRKPKTDKLVTKKTIDEVFELHKLEKRYKEITEEYNRKKKKLSNSIKQFMFANNFTSFDITGEAIPATNVKNIVRRTITWDSEKLEERLGRQACEEFMTKRYEIADMEGLVKYLKECGVSPKKFKSFLTIHRVVDSAKFNNYSEMHDIELEDLKGCYEVKISEGYLKINIEDEVE